MASKDTLFLLHDPFYPGVSPGEKKLLWLFIFCLIVLFVYYFVLR
ncbi:MAG: hypothetical protein ABH803_00375 [Candidatus Micrarchaeota archaeon]